jgi:hypothetical protein
MIEIKFDSNNEHMIVEMIKGMVSSNPILLTNIIEPCVNEIVSDVNIPLKIKEKVTELIAKYNQDHPLDVPINESISECILDVFTEKYGAEYVADIVNNFIASEDFKVKLTEILQTKIDEYLEGEEVGNRMDDAVQQYVEHEIDSNTINNLVSEQVDSMISDEHIVIEDLVNDTVDERFDNSFDPALNTAINEKVNASLTPERIDILTKEAIERYVNVEKEKIVASIPLQPLSEINKTPDISEAYDTLVIKCKRQVTPAFMWMLNALIKEGSIIIEKAGDMR